MTKLKNFIGLIMIKTIQNIIKTIPQIIHKNRKKITRKSICDKMKSQLGWN